MALRFAAVSFRLVTAYFSFSSFSSSF